MNGRWCLLFLFLAFVVAFLVFYSTPAQKKLFRKRLLIDGRPSFGLTPRPPKKPSKTLRPAQFIYSKVDHLDPSNNKTFKQRYWYNDQWYQLDGPIFLMVGGEAKEDPSWLEGTDLLWTSLAAENGAMTFLLEHRFYGESQVTSDQSTNNLKYLSSKQALEDINDFIQAMNKKFNLTGPWMTFGGSYGGNLAAWSRAMYPDLVYGAVGSSPMMEATVNFEGCLKVVQENLKSHDPTCAKSVRNAFMEMHNLMKSPSGRQKLLKGFKLCQPIDPNDKNQVTYFYSTIVENYMIVAQYSGVNGGQFYTKYTIPELCKIQTKKGYTDLQNVFDVNTWIMEYSSQTCLDIDYNDYIDYMKQSSDDRAWAHQKCTEFGNYPRTSRENYDLFGHVLPIEWYTHRCSQIFGHHFTTASIHKTVNSTNNFYSSQNWHNMSRIILVNGSKDPWHSLGILKTTYAGFTSIIINGTSHCADMYVDGYYDLESLMVARQQIRNIVNELLKNYKK